MIFTDKAAKEKISSLESQIQELEADIATKDSAIESHASEISAKDHEIAESVAREAKLQAEIADLQAKLDEAETKNAEATKEIEELTEKAEGVEALASVKAIELLASQGHPAPVDMTGDKGNTPVDHISVMASMPPAERTEYFRKNQKEIRKALK